MRSAVVVIALLALLTGGGAACTRREPQPADCATYVRCFLANDGDGYQQLIKRFNESPGDRELSCYAGFAETPDLDKLIDPSLRAYDVDGTCWAGGYGGPVSDPAERPLTDADLETKYTSACEEHCKQELAADCARTGENRICAEDDAAAFCADAVNAERIKGAVCPPVGEGEGEGE